MDNKELRRLNLLGLCSEHGRDEVAKKCGYSDTVYLNQLVNANVSRTQVGDKTARKIEEAFDLTAGWLDSPHPDIWPAEEVEKALKSSDNEILLAYESVDSARQEAVRVLLGLT
jgi:hypothetical protein